MRKSKAPKDTVKSLREERNSLRAKNNELNKVIDRISTICSEEWGCSDTVFEDELNHLFLKKTLKEFDYSSE